MTTLITGDLHESDHPRDEYRWLFLEKTLPALLRRHKVHHVLILGDLTEQKDGHKAGLVNRLVDAIEAVARHSAVYVLKGNHDYLAEDVPFFRFLRHLKAVEWINEPRLIKLPGLGRCRFLPHTRDPAKDWDSGYFVEDVDWFFCHQTFEGAKSESGRPLRGAPLSIFPKGARVISGDVHVPSKIYVGSPTTIDFGDQFEPRVLLVEEGKLRSIPVPGPQKRAVGAAATRAGKIHISDDGVRPGDVVKVNIGLDRSDVSRAAARREMQEWAERRGVKLYAVEVVASKPKAADKAADARPRQSDEELVRQYVKKMQKGKATLAAGLKLMEEVK